jgi:ferrous iron transport protein A
METAMKTLGELKVGDHAKVLGLSQGGSNYRRKLLAMGLTPSTAFVVVRMAPMGDPVEVRVRGSNLSLRRDEASLVKVELI